MTTPFPASVPDWDAECPGLSAVCRYAIERGCGYPRIYLRESMVVEDGGMGRPALHLVLAFAVGDAEVEYERPLELMVPPLPRILTAMRRIIDDCVAKAGA